MSGADIPAGPSADPPGSATSGGSTAGGMFNRLRIRRGAPPLDAVPRLEHFHITAAEKRRRETLGRSRERIVLAAGMFALLFTIVSFRVAWVTVLNPAPLKLARDVMPPAAKGPLKPITDTIAPGQRAMIVDRTGQPLALSQPTREAFADPNAIGDPVDVARKLKPILPRLDVNAVIKRLSDTSKRFVYIERQITPDEEARINNLGIPSVDFRQTQQRNYPLGRVAAHVLGGVGIDQNGIAGVELAFDQRLRDNGEPLRLSIDVRVQNVVREELMAAKEEFRAIGACGIVMDVNTGELLAVVSLPDYDANDLGSAASDDRFDRALTGRYEPGSTFKLQTASMALDLGVVHIWDTFDAAHPIHIGRFTITDFEGKHRFLALPEVLAYSSNLGAAHIALLVGGERQQAWLRSMGMFERVPVQLREADRPQFHSPQAWGEAVNMTVGFGHGISVTPLHVVAGTAAIANGGVLMKPTIIAVDPDNPPTGTRVMNPSTSDVMRRLMRLVVTSGFGKKAEVAGYYPGGKTGTAEKNQGHGYEKHANVSAFMSVFPMQAPRYAVYMMLDTPHGNAATGGYSTAGQVAAPAAGKVIARIGPILGIMPDTRDAPEIEQALAIPMQPPRGMVLGPVRFVEPTPPPLRPQIVPARVPATLPADLLHRTDLPVPASGATRQAAGPVQGNLAQGGPAQGKLVQGNPAPVNSAQVNSAQVNSAQVNSAQVNSAQVNPAQGKPGQGNSAEAKPARPAMLHQAETPDRTVVGPAWPDPADLSTSTQAPARPPQPDLLHHTDVWPVGPLPLKGRPDDRPPMRFSAVSPDAGHVSRILTGHYIPTGRDILTGRVPSTVALASRPPQLALSLAAE